MIRDATPQPVIVVADDHPGTARALARLLERIGCRARSATSGGAALDLCEKVSPDIVLLDLRMPGLDGFNVARRLRRSPHTAGVRLVAITADGDEATRARAQACGFDVLLRKPVRLETLRAVLGI